MEFNNAKLRGRIVEKFGTQAKFADAMGLSARTMSQKMTGGIDWKQSEILKACGLLGISDHEMSMYFFAV